ncbi:MAG: preprotein translocase subunit SecY [Flavobacteriales bacterium]|nr:preprotein translocase subunit SecY [Flavobacteriales bacterium]
MKKLITTLKNIWSIEELRTRIIQTLILLAVYRIGTFIYIPGVDPVIMNTKYSGTTQDGLLGLINTFSGGAFDRASIFALGIMPYISASIVVQLLTFALPSFQRMSKEGEDGRRKINQITRYLTIAVSGVQAAAYLVQLKSSKGDALYAMMPNAPLSMTTFTILAITTLVAGTMFTTWLGERITDRGLGNGISLIIMVGIISRLPFALIGEFTSRLGGAGGPIIFLVEIVTWLVVILSVILLIQGTRRVPVQYAKRIVGNKQYGGVRQYLPLKINGAGVMPIIFAQALMFIPSTLTGFLAERSSSASGFFAQFLDITSFGYNALFFILIVLFTYFYTAITYNPVQISEDLKRNSGFIPGIKPGKKTADFIDTIISRITFPGAIFIGIVAIMPSIAIIFGVNDQFAQFYGGTSLLILVGVILDTLAQIDTHLSMRKYDSLMKYGRIKGRTATGGAMT